MYYINTYNTHYMYHNYYMYYTLQTPNICLITGYKYNLYMLYITDPYICVYLYLFTKLLIYIYVSKDEIRVPPKAVIYIERNFLK